MALRYLIIIFVVEERIFQVSELLLSLLIIWFGVIGMVVVVLVQKSAKCKPIDNIGPFYIILSIS